MLPRVLTIAGTDPTGGAGLQADIKSINEAGGFPLSVTTALVAQNTCGVREVHTPPVEFLRAQLDAVFDDVQVDAVKIGMLGSAEITRAVTEYLDEHPVTHLVVDPVMVATSGDRLLDTAAESALRDLCTRATIITPNIDELAVLASTQPATTPREAIAQGRALAHDLGAAVLVKGGHLTGGRADNVVVHPSGDTFAIPNARIETKNTHGTGCSLSSSLATRLAIGQSIDDAAQWATLWLTAAIRAADDLNVGHGHGPVDHVAWNRMYHQAADTTPWEAPTGPAVDPLVAPAGPHTHALWDLVSPLVTATLSDGFLIMLADGSLPHRVFETYLLQDAYYLGEYGKALAGVAALAPTPDDMIAWARDAQGTMVEKAKLHDAVLGGATQCDPSYVTLGYTSLLTAATTKGYAVAAAAVLPCYWLYADIALRLNQHDRPDHPFHPWLEAYADEDFLETTRAAIERVERAVEDAVLADREEATKFFLYASYWEREFFGQGLRTPWWD
ncbi:MAG: bifunctional hydroxymethylpyrimidine kinase/phosphomethylpyrimidine kinase [Corynebacterium glucuronolyticum]|nr:bifunctional hydroxymethylpyrimidine kinase/phosphomethylpyrimidine kinase [Mycobacteriaceae bacterium]MDY5833287.1 bifunctional hydroxymethylpyrimidine kinase/phosphomethylpyrimidine kinase [Corynebacterium glucuronolyticum]